jgi:hypothetical protein
VLRLRQGAALMTWIDRITLAALLVTVVNLTIIAFTD